MRILNRDRGLFIAEQRSRELDCPQEPPPEKFKVLLCLIDGAERRRHIQAKLNVLDPRRGPDVDDPNVAPKVTTPKRAK